MKLHKLNLVIVDSDTIEIHCDSCPFNLTYLYSTAVARGYLGRWDTFCGEAYGAAYNMHDDPALRLQIAWERAMNAAEKLDPPISDGDELRAVVEADLLLGDTWHDRRGCNCGRHLEQNTDTLNKALEPDHESLVMEALKRGHA